MSRNIIFCIIGIALGFMIGFFFATSSWGVRPPAENVRRGMAGGASRQAPPLNPQQQQSGALPPDHPSLGGGDAASSAQLQAAMDAADRNPRD